MSNFLSNHKSKSHTSSPNEQQTLYDVQIKCQMHLQFGPTKFPLVIVASISTAFFLDMNCRIPLPPQKLSNNIKILNDYFLQHESVYQKISTKYLNIRVLKIRWNRMKVQVFVFYLSKTLWNIRLWKYQKNILFHWFENMSNNSNNVLTPDFLQIIKGLMNWRISTLVANFGQM